MKPVADEAPTASAGDEGVIFSLDGNVLGLTDEMVDAGARVIVEQCDASPSWSRVVAFEVFKEMIGACR
jgi:hypothetical protein